MKSVELNIKIILQITWNETENTITNNISLLYILTTSFGLGVYIHICTYILNLMFTIEILESIGVRRSVKLAKSKRIF